MTIASTKTAAKPAGADATQKKNGKESYSVDTIIECYRQCLTSTPTGAPERKVEKVQSGHGSMSPRAGSMAAISKTITAAADALNSPTKATKRHIHRRSIVRSGRGSLSNSPYGSFHSKSSSHRMFMQHKRKVSSGMCTVPGCTARVGSVKQSKHTFNSLQLETKSEMGSAKVRLAVTSLPTLPKNAIRLKPYLEGFRELCKLLRHFGSTMSFVVDNLMGILTVMDFHMKSDRGVHYEHVEMMIKYETMYKLVMRKMSGKDSGTKSILQLHRSQAFLIEFIKGLKNAAPKSKASKIAEQAFEASIAKYYSWLISQMASMAFSSLPSTQECLTRLGNGDVKAAPAKLKGILEAIGPVYSRVQDIYSKYRQLKCV